MRLRETVKTAKEERALSTKSEAIRRIFVKTPIRFFATFPAERMKIWLISARVNDPKNDDEGILKPI